MIKKLSMKKIFSILICCGLMTAANSQQQQSSSFYDLQGVFHNPSTAGTQKYSMVGASYRKQWSGINGGPATATIFGSTKLSKHDFGIGGYIYNDKTGPTSRTGVSMSFAKHIPTKTGTFSVGIETRFQQFGIDIEKLTQSLGADPVLGGGENKSKFDAGFGMSFTNDKFQVGASVSQLVQSKLDYYTGTLSRTGEARLYRHYYFHGLYKWAIDESTVVVPNFLLTYLPNAPTEFQGGARIEFNDLLLTGLAYRANQGWLVSAGVKIDKKATIGYSFEIYRSPLSIFDGGSNAHELLIRYDFLK
jgi:type IX secretion system PorP/SprF family membrane protein